jgi:hypothetical protein
VAAKRRWRKHHRAYARRVTARGGATRKRQQWRGAPSQRGCGGRAQIAAATAAKSMWHQRSGIGNENRKRNIINGIGGILKIVNIGGNVKENSGAEK